MISMVRDAEKYLYRFFLITLFFSLPHYVILAQIHGSDLNIQVMYKVLIITAPLKTALETALAP
jgi:hypothetical protein